jgi:hypothetical protein
VTCIYTTYGTKAFRGYSKLAEILRKLPLSPAIALGQASSAIRIFVRLARNMPNGSGFRSSPTAASPSRQIQSTTEGLTVNNVFSLKGFRQLNTFKAHSDKKAALSAIEPQQLFQLVRTGAGPQIDPRLSMSRRRSGRQLPELNGARDPTVGKSDHPVWSGVQVRGRFTRLPFSLATLHRHQEGKQSRLRPFSSPDVVAEEPGQAEEHH